MDENRERTEREKKKADESTADRAARGTARATWWIAAFTVVLAVVAILNLIEIILGGADTTKIANAAKRQACAAQKSAQAAQNFATTASLINQNINSAVGKLEDQKQAMDKARDQAQKEMNLAERAWIGVGNFTIVSNPAESAVPGTHNNVAKSFLINSGRTPARAVQAFIGFEEKNSSHVLDGRDEVWMLNALERFRRMEITPIVRNPSFPNWVRDEYELKSPTFGRVSFDKLQLGSVAPNAPRDFLSTKLNWRIPSDRDPLEPVIFGIIVYWDINSSVQRVTKFCVFSDDPRTTDMAFCPILNETK